MLQEQYPVKKNLKMSRALRKILNITALLLAAAFVVTCYGATMIIRSGMEIAHLKAEAAARIDYGNAVAELVEGITVLVHYFLVAKFLVHILANGFPFSKEGGKELRVLGWETLLLPLLANFVRLFFFYNSSPVNEIITMEIFEIVLGITLILMGYITEYAEEKLQRSHRGHAAIRYIKQKYPEIIEETKEALIEQGFNPEDVRGGRQWYDD
jgi:integral membrane sensor domain MASE1